jgi:hypothetical protein
LNSNSKATIQKIDLNSFKEMVPCLPLNFSILPDELPTSMVYMAIEDTPCNEIYGDDVKVCAATNVPH